MIFSKYRIIKLILFLNIYFFSENISSNYDINLSYNNHGVVGLINMPTARMFRESTHGISIYDGNPDQKLTFTSSPYDWLEASFFYTNIQGMEYPGFEYQDYKDKGFNFKARIKNEGKYPAVAIGINDIAGTGFYSSEYVVASKTYQKFDFHLGVGFGTLNGTNKTIKNPFIFLHESFENRPVNYEDNGGQFQPSRYFSGMKASPFYGLSYELNKNLIFKFEHDTTLTPGIVGYKESSNDYSYGLEYSYNEKLHFALSHERGNDISFKFSYKNRPLKNSKKYKYKKAKVQNTDNKYQKLIRNIENNGIGVNKIIETKESIGIELTQFAHSNIDIVEEIVFQSSNDAGISKDIKKEYRIANLKVVSEYDSEFIRKSNSIYQREKKSFFNTSNSLNLRPFLASREGFFKGALLIENDSEYIFNDSFFFNSNIKYSLLDNFNDLSIPPVDTFPEQVRSDVKDYLKTMNDGIIIGRAQFDYHITPIDNHHLMFTAGILEEMYSGVGFEYLYYKNNLNYAFGIEVFDVKKRDYKMRFETLEYSNLTSFANFYYRNTKLIPFDMKISFGEYLAGDEGGTIDMSRTFLDGTKFGVFATFTDVSAEQFGEGTFDKGIYFNIPIYQNYVNYTWRPLTKDPGARLNRKHNLYDLLSKFKPLQ
jgi:hypothetical protein